MAAPARCDGLGARCPSPAVVKITYETTAPGGRAAEWSAVLCGAHAAQVYLGTAFPGAAYTITGIQRPDGSPVDPDVHYDDDELVCSECGYAVWPFDDPGGGCNCRPHGEHGAPILILDAIGGVLVAKGPPGPDGLAFAAMHYPAGCEWVDRFPTRAEARQAAVAHAAGAGECPARYARGDGEPGVADCPCCGEHIMVSDVRHPDLCGGCRAAGCEPAADATGEMGYWQCQR